MKKNKRIKKILLDDKRIPICTKICDLHTYIFSSNTKHNNVKNISYLEARTFLKKHPKDLSTKPTKQNKFYGLFDKNTLVSVAGVAEHPIKLSFQGILSGFSKRILSLYFQRRIRSYLPLLYVSYLRGRQKNTLLKGIAALHTKHLLVISSQKKIRGLRSIHLESTLYQAKFNREAANLIIGEHVDPEVISL